MPFDLPYEFVVDGKEVVIQNKGGGNFDRFLRVDPKNHDGADSDGGKMDFARFIVEFVGNNQKIKLKSKKTGKYLRIRKDDGIDIAGGGGKFTVFKVHKQGQKGLVKLESEQFAGKYISVQKDKSIRIGAGGPWTELRFFRDGKAQQGGGGGGAQFTKPYLFKQKNTVIIRHQQGDFLRVDPKNHEAADSKGGKGDFAHFEADPSDGGNKCRFKSLKSGKYLRIQGDSVDVKGVGGKFTVFNVLKQNDGTVKLQAVEAKKYIAVGPNKVVRVGGGGPPCKMTIFRKN